MFQTTNQHNIWCLYVVCIIIYICVCNLMLDINIDVGKSICTVDIDKCI
jgi:hypothetical protein